MPSLLELQREVAAALSAPVELATPGCIIEDGMSAAARLGIYRNTYGSVLVAALRIAYPIVHKLVGADFFEAAARKFIDANPPESAYLNGYGASFGEFLSQFEPAASLAYLPDVARLERAVNGALHAPDVPGLDVARLLELDQDQQPRVSFVPHPSLTLLRCETPADRIWRAVLDDDEAALAAIDADTGPVFLLIERSASGVEVHNVSATDWAFVEMLCSGMSLQRAMAHSGSSGADVLLAEQLAAGRFAGFTVSERPHFAGPSLSQDH